MIPFDAVAWWAANKPEEAPQKAATVAPRGVPAKGANRIAKYAAGALEAECRTLEGASPGNRNNSLNRAAVAMGELVASGQLALVTVETSLAESARRIGLEDHEITKTLASGLGYGMGQPRNLNELAVIDKALPPSKPPVAGGLAKPGDDDGAPCLPGHEDNPHRLARIFLREKFSHPDGYRLRFWNDEFHAWARGAYRPYTKQEARGIISNVLQEEFERVYHSQLLQAAGPNGEGKAPRPYPVTTNIVGHVTQALSGITMLPKSEFPEQPCWVDQDEAWPVHEIMPMRNAVVHLPSYADGLPCTRKPTPRLFCPYVLNYDFDPDAPQPTRWIQFLHEVWPDDPESIDALQEWMGLQLVPNTRYQKIMALIGPPGSGKGTIIRAMQAMIGNSNCDSIRFSAMDDRFFLESAIGKLSLVIPDGRVPSKPDLQSAILEALLSISGEDTLTIPRKHIAAWTGKLVSRITIVSNDIPKFTDPSVALSRRLIVLRFQQDFRGREDKELEDKLGAELPGILLWAIEGWKRLYARGKFLQPASGKEEMRSLRDLASPISLFIEDCCDVGQDNSRLCSDVYRAYRAWCEENGRKDIKDLTMFSRELRSVIPHLTAKQVRTGGGKPRHYFGLTLKPPGGQGDAPAQAPPGGFDFGDIPGVPF